MVSEVRLAPDVHDRHRADHGVRYYCCQRRPPRCCRGRLKARPRARPECCRVHDLVFVPVCSDQGSRHQRAASPALAVPGRAGNGSGITRSRTRYHDRGTGESNRSSNDDLPQRRGHQATRRRLRVRVRCLPWPAASILGNPQVGSASEPTGPLPGTFPRPVRGTERHAAVASRTRHSTGGDFGSTRPAPKGRSPYRPAEAGTRPPPRRRRLDARPNRP